MADRGNIAPGGEPTKGFGGTVGPESLKKTRADEATAGPGPDDSRRLSTDAAARLLRALADTPGLEEHRSEGEAGGADGPAIPGYTLDRRIGSGGGGEVYHGFREGSDRPLAIKVIRSDPARAGGEGAATRRAWRELDLTSQLRLPAVPRVIDYGFAGSQLFVASEYIDGPALDRYADDNRLDRRGRVELLARVADAVHSVHEHGVIHRDLKPSNILVGAGGTPVIIDLGVAVLAEGARDLTVTADGTPIGTPTFMAPEQARGDRARISIRSDVYGLGATALIVLTRHGPHDLRGLPAHAAVARVANQPARDPGEIDPSLPRALAAVLAKALQFEPTARYSSAADLAADLRRWLKGDPVEARRASGWTRITRWAANHPVLTGAALTAFLGTALVVAAVAGAYATMSSRIDSISVIDTSTVMSYSRFGLRVRQWTTGQSNGVILAEIVDRPEPLGGGRILVVALQRQLPNRSIDTELSMFECGDPVHPFWTMPLNGPEIRAPLTLSPRPSDHYRIRQVLVCDVFADAAHPGPELVVLAHETHRAASVLEIRNLTGELLFRRWHDGQLSSMYWMSAARRLVLAGVSNCRTVRELGYVAPAEVYSPNLYPYVCIAIDPVVETGTPNSGGGMALLMDDAAGAAWRRLLLPLDLVDRATVPVFVGPREGADPGRHATLKCHPSRRGEALHTKSVYLTVDAEGRLVGAFEDDGLAVESGGRWAAECSLVDLRCD